MSTTAPASYLADLDRIITDVVAPKAAEVDRTAAFPRAQIDALAKAGLLGLVSAKEVGGMGLGHRAAAGVVEKLARECASTAMVVCMHYAGTAVIEAHGPRDVREAIAKGQHLTTLAFSEAGSRSHFWAPTSTASAEHKLDAQKSWCTSAGQADSYVWSSKPVAAEGASTIWLVDAKAPGLTIPRPFEGLGLRGNHSAPITAQGVAPIAMLGADAGGFDIMMGIVLPYFQVMSAAFSVGTMEAATAKAAAHCAGTKFEHLGSALADLPTIRAYVARMRIKTDMAGALLADTLTAIESGREDTMLRVLECKAAAGEASTEVTDLAMRVCGGAAFRADVGVERNFRDARAATVMAPTTDVLYDFIGKAATGLPLFGEAMADRPYLLGAVAYDPKVVTIWEGFKQFFRKHGFEFDYVLYSNYERQVEAHLAGHFDVAWNSPLAWIRAERLAKAAGREVKAVAMRDTDQDLTSVVVARADGPVQAVADLRGKTVGVGAVDSPQATLLPLLHLEQQGLVPGQDFQIRYFDVLGGKHGDHIGGERDAARALVAGEIDAACMIDGNHLLFTQEGTLAPGTSRVVTQTAPYDHCNFSVCTDGVDPARFVALLMAMRHDDPEVRPLLDLEGLKAWRDGRVEGYKALDHAATRFGFYDERGTITASNYRY